MTPKRIAIDDTLCPVARSMAIVGDRWTVLILLKLFSGCSRFNEIQAQTGATAQMLATRLKRLEADGSLEQNVYSQRPVRREYKLTPMGRDFYPIILALRAWGETWCKRPREPIAVRMTHSACGTEVGLDGSCPSCGRVVPPSDLDAAPSPKYAAERQRRREAYHAGSQTKTRQPRQRR
jgi:DNA-binding HxlR family transcriptional regulator